MKDTQASRGCTSKFRTKFFVMGEGRWASAGALLPVPRGFVHSLSSWLKPLNTQWGFNISNYFCFLSMRETPSEVLRRALPSKVKAGWKWNLIGESLWNLWCWIRLLIYYFATALYKYIDAHVSEGKLCCPDLREPVGISQGCRWAVEMHVYIISSVPLAVTSSLMTNLSPLVSWKSVLWWFSALDLSVFPFALMGSTRTFKNRHLFEIH